MFPQILKGVSVLDFSRLLPGPFASELLIRLGAKVTCILPPVEDPILGAYSPFETLKRGKDFLSLDLKVPTDLQQAQELLRSTSIVLEGFRPGVMGRLGLGFRDAQKLNPQILYVSLNGYGADHPKYRQGAHDLNFLVDSGLYSLLFADHAEEMPIIQLADVLGGFYAAFQIVVHWMARTQKGEAKHLQVSIVEGLELLSAYLRDEATFPLLNFLTGGLARYHIYKTKDHQRIMVGAIEEKFFQNFLKVLELQNTAELSETELMQKIQQRLNMKTLTQWREIFQNADACISFIPSRQEVLKNNF